MEIIEPENEKLQFYIFNHEIPPKIGICVWSIILYIWQWLPVGLKF